ncbi:nitrogen fixation protein NifU [Desulfonispora thiosulfatigenes DSM 11270]|uniref:Nitrogen fixation protein NifU n=1 Tax=Desulfonispora thiosulfatigenes DSM 11270 TaxID=656914 RepID=A0A1W1UJH3_DESTI|nr:iron-sulfur cluster assembly scaffold protein [Desulfonispora thiosulfatigenes]SMB81275.1 nitrogen fixation protein NifU [Desulfonispora thiosulfatigenes DSM 11270]
MNSSLDDFIKEVEEEIWSEFSEVAVDHMSKPRNLGPMEEDGNVGFITGDCGDSIKIWLKIKDDLIEKISFMTDGCGTTVAAGSMTTELAKGKSINDSLLITPVIVLEELGGFPEDSVHCAVLATNALHDAINNYKNTKK